MVNTRRGGGFGDNDLNNNPLGNDPNNNPPNPPPPVYDLVQMVAMQNQMMQTMAQMMTALQQMAQPNPAPLPPPPSQKDTLRRIMMTQPPIFKHAVEPMDADDWL